MATQGSRVLLLLSSRISWLGKSSYEIFLFIIIFCNTRPYSVNDTFRFGVSLRESFGYVQSKRFCCNPNEGFMGQLREFEPIYRGKKLSKSSETNKRIHGLLCYYI